MLEPDYLTIPTDSADLTAKGFTPYACEPIAGQPGGKDLLSALQLSADDIMDYIDGAEALEKIIKDPKQRGLSIIKYAMVMAVMRQPSTRTGGSEVVSASKGDGEYVLVSGMQGSSEAKGESLRDSWLAFATQADILGIRTAENGGPAFAASVIDESVRYGKLSSKVPVINLGDGENEHVTQGLGDMMTTYKRHGKLDGLVSVYVGAFDRYRAFNSDMIMAAKLGQTIVAVECPAAPISQNLVDILGPSLERTTDLDEAMRYADELNIGRNPDEYEGHDAAETARSQEVAAFYKRNAIDLDRLQQMRPDAIVKHPRPRRNELHPSVDGDPRMADVQQMENMIPMRLAITAMHLGVDIRTAIREQQERELAIQRVIKMMADADIHEGLSA
jgi:aspartate carbamoyltransferase catalytic subunit